MKRAKQLQKAFGTVAETSFAAFPPKTSNVNLARLIYGNDRGCAHCFPHGPETSNATILSRQRSWKQFRRTQWKA